ncbi:arsenate reductase ArsC [Candidatus Gottesmanbacteria bacterium]|nr:arsenate reductase ArsC [Candidatus Gottesmanbacteria bacterium]
MNYILFICGHNAGRSQMAQAFFNVEKKKFPYVDKNYEAVSAGTRPGTSINPTVIEAMKEINIDMNDASIYHPKPLTDGFIISKGKNLKRAIIACDDSCVLPKGLPQITLERWNLPDPHNQPLEIVRKVRNAVKTNIIKLIKELDTFLI